MRATTNNLSMCMTPIRSGVVTDLGLNRASNGVHPVRLKILNKICREEEV